MVFFNGIKRILSFIKTVKIVDNNNGLITERYYRYNKLHRNGDKPAEIYYFKNGNIRHQVYYRYGLLHRNDDKPAIVINFPNGNIGYEEYCRDGIAFREGGPINITYYKDSCVLNKLFRNYAKNGDANDILIKYNRNGNISSIMHMTNYNLHRDCNKPAVKLFNKNGILLYEAYYRDGLLHNDNNAAIIKYYKNGRINSVEYYHHGKHADLFNDNVYRRIYNKDGSLLRNDIHDTILLKM